MSVAYNTTLKNTRMTDVVTAIDGGSGAGYLQIGTTGMGTVLAEFVFSGTCGTVSGGVLTFSGMPMTVACTATGTAAVAQVFNGSGTSIISGLTVGTSGTDIILASTSLTTSEPITLSSASITHG